MQNGTKNVSTERKNRVMIFFGKGWKFITESQEYAFLQASNSSAKGMRIDGDFVSFSSVAKIIGIDDFYRENPEEKPTGRPEMMNLFQAPISIRKFEKYDTRALELMRKGLAGYMQKTPWMNSGKRPAQEVLEKMDTVIEKMLKKSENPYFSKAI